MFEHLFMQKCPINLTHPFVRHTFLIWNRLPLRLALRPPAGRCRRAGLARHHELAMFLNCSNLSPGFRPCGRLCVVLFLRERDWTGAGFSFWVE